MTAPRWEFSGWTLCMPRYCIFSYACPVKALRQGSVQTYQCLRYLPARQQPAPALSPYALEVLERLRRQKKAPAAAGKGR